MRLRVIGLLFFALAFILSSCAPEHSQIVLAKFGNQNVKMGEFENAYAKNVGSLEKAKQDSLSQLKNFLNLYVDFRMKLRDAYVRGYDNNPELQNELTDYKKKVGVTYLLEKKLVDPGINTLYDRRKFELRVSHIMIRPDSTGWDHAKTKAEALLDSLNNGADFATLAEKYSQDTFSKPRGGDIYYITAGDLPYQFEDAAYNTEVGTYYPKVVKSPYGYHIIKVTEKRERVPEIRVSHILASFFKHPGKADSVDAKAKIDTVMEKLKAGEDFAKLAKEYSDDPGSAKNGGDVGFFKRRMMVQPFDEAAFNLKNIGDVSGIVKTRFGYHIIKLTGKKPYPTFDEDRDNLKKIFKRQRYQDAYDSLVAGLRTKYDYKLNQDTFGAMVGRSDTTKVGQDNPAFDEIKNLTLFTYSDSTVNVGQFLEKLAADNDFSAKPMNPDLLKKAIEKISAGYLLNKEAMGLDKTDPEFASLMKDYRDGIYIFKLQEDEVWNKVKVDSTDLKNYYEKTKDNYVWPDRVNFSEIFTRTDSLAQEYYRQLQNGANFDTLAAKYTERPGYKKLAGNHGLVYAAESDLSQKANQLKSPGDYSKPFNTRGGFAIVKLVAKDPSHLKTFEEAKPEVSGAFQDAESKKLEKNYVQELRNRYNPVIHYDELEKAYKSN